MDAVEQAWTLISDCEDDGLSYWDRYREMGALGDCRSPSEYLQRRLKTLVRDLPEGRQRQKALDLLDTFSGDTHAT